MALVLLAFFILAIQLFVTLLEFKLTVLAGFVLIPFGLFGKTAFMAERVLGNVVSSGIKILVLAVVVGIGSTLFSEFTSDFANAAPTIDQAMAIVLAALSLVALGIFGPGIANGLISGGPQLGAGAAVGTGLAVGGAALAAGGGAMLAGRAGVAAVQGGAAAAGAASSAYTLGSLGQTGASGVASGLGGVARAGGSAAVSPLRRAASDIKSRFSEGAKGGVSATGGHTTMGTVPKAGEAANDPDYNGGRASAAPASSASGAPPAWAQRMKRSQTLHHGITTAAHAVRSGDSHGGGSSVNLTGTE